MKNYNDTVITCGGNNDFFLHDNVRIRESFDRISCEKYPAYTARATGVRCGNGVSVEIGFSLDSQMTNIKKLSKNVFFYQIFFLANDSCIILCVHSFFRRRHEEFYRVIDLCHDDILGHTIYAHARIFAAIDAAQTSFPRTAFRKGRFFRGIDIQKVYGRDSQRETIGRILDSDQLADLYIPETGFLPNYSLSFFLY